MPVRVQQRRTRGWRKPENTVSVARPTKWGNPITITSEDCEEQVFGGVCYVVRNTAVRNREIVHKSDMRAARQVAVDVFRAGVLNGMFGYGVGEVKARLRGKNLMCFCPLDHPCHADVLLELANPAPAPALCPECRDGKCRNCIGEAMTEDDELVPCGCPKHEINAEGDADGR